MVLFLNNHMKAAKNYLFLIFETKYENILFP